MMEFLNRSVRTARKTHRCEDCGRPIVPSSRYGRALFRDGGNLMVWKSHLACEQAVGIVVDEAPHYVFQDGWPRVLDFEREDFETVRAIDPEVWAAVI